MRGSDVRVSGGLSYISVNGNLSDSRFNVGGKLNTLFVTRRMTNTSVQAGELGGVLALGGLNASSPGLHSVHADTGSFYLVEDGDVHLLGYGFPGSPTDTTINNVRVHVG
jgi:hypothetical protein